ncbi:hypothetical protein AB0H28_08135 [Micromonospora sp. NPDC050980]|uniref:hypothetical protein n=1 Tax=Micromonospora sp. NPDC050980 TaxID=3155161 RepID=UPI003409D8E9
MMVARLDGLSLSRLRLAASPVAEATHWMRVTLTRSGHPVHGDPGPVARAALRHPDVALAAHLLTPAGRPGYMPDLLTPKPPPGPPETVLERQLAAVAATPAELVATQVAARYGGRPAPPMVRAALAEGTLAARVAVGLRRFWQEALADRWPQVRTLLEAELAGRAARMATGGVGSLLDGRDAVGREPVPHRGDAARHRGGGDPVGAGLAPGHGAVLRRPGSRARLSGTRPAGARPGSSAAR